MTQEKGIVQHFEFRITGLSRSGNHAVINWIIHQLKGGYLFLNCTEPKFNPYLTARPMDDKGNNFRTNIANFDLEREQQGNFSPKQYLLYNHEDCFLGSFNKKEQKEKQREWIGPSKVRKDILILRDPFNLFASRIKAGLLYGHFSHGARPISESVLKRIYKQHAREFLGEKNNLQNKIIINFNSWSKDLNYRRKIAEALDLSFSDKGFKEVTAVAGGSSFDGTNLSGKADKMKLDERWKTYAEDERYWSLFDHELLDLTRKIFGDIPAAQFMSDMY